MSGIKRSRNDTVESEQVKRQRIRIDDDQSVAPGEKNSAHRASSLPVPIRHANQSIVDLGDDEDAYSDSIIDISIVGEDDDDDDDIPYTHSRSQSPDLAITHESKKKKGSNSTTRDNTRKTTPANAEVIDLDNDDIATEYYVIDSDEDEDDDDAETVIEKASQKPVKELLAENMKSSNSNLNTAHCAVCFDSPEETCVLPCGHIYCRGCVFKALSSMKSSTKTTGPCSLCRAPTSYKRVTVGIFKKKKKTLEGC